ncbi:MAG: hypothetical protein FWH03_03120 [Firmicutes bacterium]|nr:hypothetical protein [Bacillota bacterium]
MKKIVLVVISVMLALAASGCGGGAAAEPFDREKPWGTPSNAYERKEYTVEVFQQVKAEDGSYKNADEPLASGQMTHILSTSGAAGANRAAVSTDFSISWQDTEGAGVNRGKSDTIISSVLFNTGNLAPVSSEKTVNLASRTVNGAARNDSYFAAANYSTHKSTVRFGKENESAEGYLAEREFSIEGGLFDNEQLWYVLRAFRNMQLGAQMSFSLNNPVNQYAQWAAGEKYGALPMVAAVATAHEKIKLGAFIDEYLPEPEEDDVETEDDGEEVEAADPREILCLVVGLSIQAEQSGPPHVFYITDPSVQFNRSYNTSKLIVKYEYIVYDSNRNPELRYVYTLSDYSTRRGA